MARKLDYYILVGWLIGLLGLLIYPPCNANGTEVGIGHYLITDVGALVPSPFGGFDTVPTIAWDKLILEVLVLTVVVLIATVLVRSRQKS